MAQVIRYLALVLILAGISWKVYRLYGPTDQPGAIEDAAPIPPQVGDSESDVTAFYGDPIGVSGRGGITTYFFKGVEVDLRDEKVSEIRDAGGVSGSLKFGEHQVIIDTQNKIGEQ